MPDHTDVMASFCRMNVRLYFLSIHIAKYARISIENEYLSGTSTFDKNNEKHHFPKSR